MLRFQAVSLVVAIKPIIEGLWIKKKTENIVITSSASTQPTLLSKRNWGVRGGQGRWLGRSPRGHQVIPRRPLLHSGGDSRVTSVLPNDTACPCSHRSRLRHQCGGAESSVLRTAIIVPLSLLGGQRARSMRGMRLLTPPGGAIGQMNRPQFVAARW